MMRFDELKGNKALQSRIDWDLTPQEAFEAYQLKSINAWKQRGLTEALFFSIYVYHQEPRLLLVARTLKDTEELCLIPVPADLLHACVDNQGGFHARPGQYPIDEPIKEWLKKELA